ncbi:hemicentin-1-like isoform X1 [Galleria mellonella]|uniref:Hemicentin-1-like isoform X1 n=1 Tax=Galleria mellonella TaxID=7137 RepID=A0A6J1WLS5_GALME|nr:hemicentin-1-like isoform X1 [Galleria mellonella]
MGTSRLLSPFTLLLICAAGWTVRAEDEQHDAREGDDVTMQCRFSLEPFESLTYYWVRNTASGHDNVAIGDIPLETNYQISFAPTEGRYDLMVANVSYERDNGRFECRVKAGGSGRTLHSQGHALTVLTHPRAPLLTPGPHAQAQENRELKLACSSSGGSPEPSIKWYREGSLYPLEAELTHAKTRAEPSISTITLNPTREDDGATFRCVVWNRAMPEGQQLDATVDLNVNYFPRVDVGPENPLRVEIDGTATLECKVDAKPKVNTVRWTRNGKYISNSFTHAIQGVTVQDAGKYTCSADNGLGSQGEKDIYLDVLYPPTVTVESKTFEAEEDGTVEIRCDVSANPKPTTIEWTMEGKPEFRQNGNTLLLTRVNADMAGTYICRAVNDISTSTGKRVERASSASVAVLVRHKPGRAHISPDRPVAQEGSGVTLTCSAKPPGWPAPQYRWFLDVGTAESKPNVLATGSKYTIPSAHLGSEGIYRCQATNELGHSEMASVTLQVHQPPRFQSKLQPHMIKRAGELDFSVSCSALGKPRPIVKWFKDNSEIKLDTDLYEIKTDITEGRNSVYNVQSMLKFYGKSRPNTNQLLPDDRGIYTCTFENEVKRVESTVHLRIEHEPLAIRPQKKVAYDIAEVAEIFCRVQAYPKPEFQWFYGSNTSPLQMSSDGHYDITTTTDNNDSYLSILKIRGVKPQDFGDYYCKVKNALGSIRPQTRLQPKGAPESPKDLTSEKIGPSYVTLKWEAGFDGGLTSTKYFVRYRRVMVKGVNSAGGGEHCATEHTEYDWMEYDCGRSNPCNVTRLEQHSSYTFKVKAVNTKGQSNYSNEITVTTKVDKIAAPEQVTYDPSTRTIAFSVGPTCLSLIGVAEGLNSIGGAAGWQVVDTVPLHLSGAVATVQEAPLEIPNKQSTRTMPGRHIDTPYDDMNPHIRLKLCLKVNQEVCSEYTEADIGPSYIKEASALTPATMIAIVVSCLVFLLFLALLFVFCHCKLNDKNKKETSKDYEMDSMRPPMVAPQNQAPPPYYQSAGMENKALEHSMDLATSIDDAKNVYGSSGYAYHMPPHVQGHPVQNMPNTDWVNMAYNMENSYTNSNNGGSVNSQDSLWQMKLAANNPGGMPGHQIIDRQSNYAYDQISQPAYGTIDDYPAYPPMPHGGQMTAPPDYNMRGSQNPSRQDFCSDPYASVHKPKKRMDVDPCIRLMDVDPCIDPSYHEVTGLPEGYGGSSGGGGGEDAGPEDKPPHLSLSYDDSLESGYSTPNSRSRRVIREIIV